LFPAGGDSYIYVLHSRLSQILGDAVHNGSLPVNPCSRRTAPRTGKERLYVATEEQVWALHDALEPRYRAGLLRRRSPAYGSLKSPHVT
jgi:hypothetical protein